MSFLFLDLSDVDGRVDGDGAAQVGAVNGVHEGAQLPRFQLLNCSVQVFQLDQWDCYHFGRVSGAIFYFVHRALQRRAAHRFK